MLLEFIPAQSGYSGTLVNGELSFYGYSRGPGSDTLHVEIVTINRFDHDNLHQALAARIRQPAVDFVPRYFDYFFVGVRLF